jgi:ribosome-interacting GTPase 1
MNIIFTDHALLRCKQGKLNKDKLSYQILNEIPNFKKEINWSFGDGSKVVVSKRNGDLIVITVVPKERIKKNRKVRFKDGTFTRIK